MNTLPPADTASPLPGALPVKTANVDMATLEITIDDLEDAEHSLLYIVGRANRLRLATWNGEHYGRRVTHSAYQALAEVQSALGIARSLRNGFTLPASDAVAPTPAPSTAPSAKTLSIFDKLSAKDGPVTPSMIDALRNVRAGKLDDVGPNMLDVLAQRGWLSVERDGKGLVPRAVLSFSGKSLLAELEAGGTVDPAPIGNTEPRNGFAPPVWSKDDIMALLRYAIADEDTPETNLPKVEREQRLAALGWIGPEVNGGRLMTPVGREILSRAVAESERVEMADLDALAFVATHVVDSWSTLPPAEILAKLEDLELVRSDNPMSQADNAESTGRLEITPKGLEVLKRHGLVS